MDQRCRASPERSASAIARSPQCDRVGEYRAPACGAARQVAVGQRQLAARAAALEQRRSRPGSPARPRPRRRPTNQRQRPGRRRFSPCLSAVAGLRPARSPGAARDRGRAPIGDQVALVARSASSSVGPVGGGRSSAYAQRQRVLRRPPRDARRAAARLRRPPARGPARPPRRRRPSAWCASRAGRRAPAARQQRRERARVQPIRRGGEIASQHRLPRQLVPEDQQLPPAPRSIPPRRTRRPRRRRAGDRREQPGLDARPDRPRRLEHRAAGRRQPRGARQHRVAHRRRQRPPAAGQHLGDEERVAAGLPVQRGRVERALPDQRAHGRLATAAAARRAAGRRVARSPSTDRSGWRGPTSSSR